MKETNQTKWTLLVNPHAGGGKGKRDLQEIKDLLDAIEISYDVLISEYPRHAIKLAQVAIENGVRNLIVAGGDGTLNEVVNGLFLQNVCLPEEVTIGMIPVGTGNDWIKTFGIPINYAEAITLLLQQKTLLQDVGKLTYKENGEKTSRYFSNMAGFGFDALTAQKANALKEKERSGLLVYLQSLIWAFLHYKTRKVEIQLDEEKVGDLIFSVSIGIGKYNGGGMMQAPNAVPNNGLFEVTLIKKIGLWGILTNLSGLYSGKYVKDYRVQCFKAQTIIISSENPLAAEVDGESLGHSQFEIEMLTKKLQVVVGDKMTLPSE